LIAFTEAKTKRRTIACEFIFYYLFFYFHVISSQHIDFVYLISSMSKRGKRADSAAPQTEGRCRPNWPISARGATGGPSGDGFLRLFESGDGRGGRSCCLGVFLGELAVPRGDGGESLEKEFFFVAEPGVHLFTLLFLLSLVISSSLLYCVRNQKL
jgi:hypothetical protein